MKNTLFSLFVVFACLQMAAESLPARLQKYTRPDYWKSLSVAPPVSREHLLAAIEAARVYYLNQQFKEGNFLYAMNLSNGELYEDDNQVRQAGALWGLSCLNRDRFTENTRRALLAGIDFFERRQKKIPSGEMLLSYPDEEILKTGTAALFCLSLIEFLIGQEEFLPLEVRQRYQNLLDQQLDYLQSMEMADGSWAGKYDLPSGYREMISSPYYDGETLLAYCRAARFLKYDKLKPRINAALPLLLEKYTLKCWEPGSDSDDIRGFYQWGSMACAEIVEAGWPNAELAAQATLAMAWWQIYDNNIESRDGNTAYALEGLIAAWRIAKQRNDQESMNLIRPVIERCLGRLMVWQVGGPFQKQNTYLNSLPRVHPKAYGGITSALNSNIIRIDNVQHQLHAMLLALEYLY